MPPVPVIPFTFANESALSGITYDRAPGFSFIILLTLALVVAASAIVFAILVRRCTSHRQWLSLSEWAAENGFKPGRTTDQLPPPLAAFSPQVRLSFTGSKGTLLQLQTDSGDTDTPATARWNVLLRKTGGAWIPSGLRPAMHQTSVMDKLSLNTYPAYSTQERFHLVSADNAAARKLSKSSARALLPADVGLLLWGEWLVLDFTHRPFDPIEFGRMLAVAEQIARIAG